MPFLALLLVFGLATGAKASPQKDSLLYTDFRPEYTQWQDNYILDKIEYWSDRTVFFFRYKAEWEGGNVTYYGPRGASPWYLKNLDPKPGIPNSYNLVDVRNIRVKGVLRSQSLRNQAEFKVLQVLNEVHTAEIVFPRLPVGLEKVDLVEGRGNEASELHFNALRITVKPPGDKSLGTEKDMDRRINTFEKGLPKEPEPEPEPPQTEVVPEEPEPAPKVVAAEKPIVDNSLPPDNVIRIVFAKDGVKPSSPNVAFRYLEDIRLQLLSHPSWKINIVGYADANLDEAKAVSLSQARAEMVFNYFATRGIAVERLLKSGAGASVMVAKKGESANRRVEISYFK